MQTYVYKGKEVFMTGRTAEKTVRGKTMLLHEILPIKYRGQTEGVSKDVVSNWVKESELFTINQNEEDDAENKV